MAARDLLEPLEHQRASTLRLVDLLTAEQLDTVHPASGWSVRQILAHVARSELGEAFFIRTARAGQVIDMSLGERDSFNADGVDDTGGWDAARLRSELEDARDALREEFDQLEEADLGLAISWPEWPARTIRDSLPYMQGHEDEHVAQVKQALGQPTGSTS